MFAFLSCVVQAKYPTIPEISTKSGSPPNLGGTLIVLGTSLFPFPWIKGWLPLQSPITGLDAQPNYSLTITKPTLNLDKVVYHQTVAFKKIWLFSTF
jgi:hypothetical protein